MKLMLGKQTLSSGFLLPASRRQFLTAAVSTLLCSAVPVALRAQTVMSVVKTAAGTGLPGFDPDQGVGLRAISTPINNPYGVTAGPDGALYFCEVDTGRTRRLDLESGRLTTIAGSGAKAYTGDGGPALEASFSAPHEIRFDNAGNLYIVERDAHVVRKIDMATGIVSTVAGTGEAGYGGDGGPAEEAQLRQPHSIAFDSRGNLLICDIGNSRVRSVDVGTGLISTLGGTGERIATPDNGPLSRSPLLGPRSIDTDLDGNAYLVLREGNAVYRLDAANDSLQRIAGTGIQGYSGDGGAAIEASFNGPKGIAYSAADHSLYIVDTENHVIRRMDLANGMIETVLGNGERGDGPDGDPLQCMLNRPHGVYVNQGIVYVTDSENHRIRALTAERL